MPWRRVSTLSLANQISGLNVPIASLSGSILASTDRLPLVMGALQLMELLLTKSPQTYRTSSRRKGVLHATESISSRKLSHKSKEAKDKDKWNNKEKQEGDGSAATSPKPPAPTPAPPKEEFHWSRTGRYHCRGEIYEVGST